MGNKIHVPDHQWRKDQRKQKFSNKKRVKKSEQYKDRYKHRDDGFDDEDLSVHEWQKKWRD